MESPKSWNSMSYFCSKNTFLHLKHYMQRIYQTLLSTTCVKIHQTSYVISETISHFSRHNSSLFFTSNITYFWKKYVDKKEPSKCKFSDFQLLPWKLTKFLISFFKPPASFSLNIASPSNVMTHSSSVIFQLNILSALVKFNKFLMSFMKPQIMMNNSSVCFSSNIIYVGQKEPIKGQILRLSSVISLKFFSWNIICFAQKEPIRVQFLRLSCACHQILHVKLEITSQFFFKLCITLQCQEG